jgi:tetratricopeptide (TPR) repeat protein
MAPRKTIWLAAAGAAAVSLVSLVLYLKRVAQSSALRPSACSGRESSPELHVVEDTKERQQALSLFASLKKAGNEHFQRGEYHEALESYQNAVDVCSCLSSADAEAVSAIHTVQSNVILVLLKLEQYERARMLATFMLQGGDGVPTTITGPLKPKILYRRALAMKHLGDLDGAIGDMTAAKSLAGEDQAINDELVALLRLKGGKG